jgi:hypothetical protein
MVAFENNGLGNLLKRPTTAEKNEGVEAIHKAFVPLRTVQYCGCGGKHNLLWRKKQKKNSNG